MSLHSLERFSSGSSLGKCDIGYGPEGTEYGESAIEYSHGPDGKIFLDPYIEQFLRENISSGTQVADLGCGTGTESIRCAELGGLVWAIDYQASMVTEASRRVSDRGLKDRVSIVQGDASNLRQYGVNDQTMDVALSILVTCNLPEEIVGNYIQEMGRILKDRGRAIFTLATSFDLVFTKGEKDVDEAKAEIEELLEYLPDNPSMEVIECSLKRLTDVYAATFVMEGSRLVLVTDMSQMRDGTRFIRKLPDVVLPNIYYSEQTYQRMFAKAGLEIVEELTPSFESPLKRRNNNLMADKASQLGKTYIHNPMFSTKILKKRG